MKVVFWGTPEHAVPYIDTILQHHDLVAVVTQPDRRCGRGRKLTAPPVKQRALQLAVPVLQPEKPDAQFAAQLAPFEADVFVVVAYGHILCREILQLPRIAAVNVHYSLLPALRGAAPVQHALMQGLTETGVTVQYIGERLDAGDIILQRPVPIEPHDNCQSLTQKLTAVGTELLAEALRLLEEGSAPRIPQDEEKATYAPSLTRADGAIDWARPAEEIVNLVRACYGWPGTWCESRGRRLKIVQASVAENIKAQEGEPGTIVEIDNSSGAVVILTGRGAATLELVQPESKGVMRAADYLRGARLGIGDKLQ